MQQIIRRREIIADTWRHLGAEEPIPATGQVIVPLARALAEPPAPGRALGVSLSGEDDVEALRPLLEGVGLVAIEFPRFADGRGYSQARLLRERLGYTGPLRAFGDVLRDQLMFMERVGFDEFAVRADKDVWDALRAFETFSVTYREKQAV